MTDRPRPDADTQPGDERRYLDRRRFLAGLGAASVGGAGLAGCSGPQPSSRAFLVGKNGFEVEDDGREELLVRGVNLGMAKPGHFPGEAAITREEYDRWLAAIGEMGANAIRTYTVHPPAFYDALGAYNEQSDEPLYLLAGTWVEEEALLQSRDATALTDEFETELRRTVDTVHGATTLPDRPGHASGQYRTDVSDVTLGYVAGIEWSPAVVMGTNERDGRAAYDGQYVGTTGAPPFERWLARSLDAMVSHEEDEYGVSRPVSFTNWVTTDPLDHPYEPFAMEDAVPVDPDLFRATGEFAAGLFASYHVYPYYPDLLNVTPDYVDYTDHRGEANSYAGYLADLVTATEQPLLVAEFGVPDSRGKAHDHVHGRHQGGHTEREQGEHVAAMFEDIVEAGCAGGVAFAWHDEWFKRTWNLMTFSEPSRRPFWSNVQTPEQRFGLLTFEPTNPTRLDGSDDGWGDALAVPSDGPPRRLVDGHDRARTIRRLEVTHDLEALSLRVELESLSDPVDWSALTVLLAVGVSGRGNTTLDLGTETEAEPTDFLVRLAGPGESRVRVDAYYDAFAHRFGAEAGLEMDAYRERDSGRFTPVRMTINRGYTVPPTDERVPFEAVETGRLRYGVGDPDHPEYDSQADVHVATERNTIAVRLPWLLLNVSDPSSRFRLGDLWSGGGEGGTAEDVHTMEPFDALAVGAATYAPDADGTARAVPGPTNLTHAVPAVDDGVWRLAEYTWETWNEPEYRERTKESYEVVRDAFETFGR